MLLGDAWTAAADSCVAYAKSQGADGGGEATRKACQPVLDKALVAIKAAADAVDSWAAIDQQNWPCLAKSAVSSLSQLATLFPGLTLPQIVTDAMNLINGLSSQTCVVTVDGGNG